MVTRRCIVVLAVAGLWAAYVRSADYQAADPTWMPSKLYFFGGALRPRVMTLVDDPAASTGKAGFAQAGVSEPGFAADSYTYERVPGRYLTRFLFKVADNAGATPVVSYGIGGPIGKDPASGGDNCIPLKPSDFKEPGGYQAFEYRWEYYEHGFMVAAVNWMGGRDLWWGGVETQLIEPFSDERLLEIWRKPPTPELSGSFPPKDVRWPTIPDSAQIKPGPPRVHMAEGMYFDLFGIEQAVKQTAGGSLTESETLSGEQLADICPSFPSAEELFEKHNVIVLANVDIRRLGVLRRYLISEFVNRGGGLLVLGGPWTFGRCAMRGTWVDQMLPVQITGLSDWAELAGGTPIRWTDEAPPAMKSAPTDDACVCFLHRADVRPGGQVLLKAGEQPALVAWPMGKGRVAAFLATPMGTPAEGRIGFWQSPAWPGVMAKVLDWLSQAQAAK